MGSFCREIEGNKCSCKDWDHVWKALNGRLRGLLFISPAARSGVNILELTNE